MYSYILCSHASEVEAISSKSNGKVKKILNLDKFGKSDTLIHQHVLSLC